MEFTEHVLERYAERIQDKGSRNDIKSFVAQNREMIQDNILKLFNSAEYLCGDKIKVHNFTHFYVNKDGWVIIVDKDKKKIITLYKIDLKCSSNLNKLYIDEMTSNIRQEIEEIEALELQMQENNEEVRKNIVDNNNEIATLKKQIQWLEEQNKTLEQNSKEKDAELKFKQKELHNRIEDFVGARIFE